MNRNQWFVFGIGLIIFSGYMFSMAMGWGGCATFEGDLLISCSIRRYAYAIPAIISMFLGNLFLICSFLERKKK